MNHTLDNNNRSENREERNNDDDTTGDDQEDEERGSANDTNEVCMFNVRVSTLMGTFSILTALAHFLLQSGTFDYKKWIFKENANYFRWIEYSITSSIMVLGVTGLTGIVRSEEAVPIFILTGITNILGLGIECIKLPKNDKDLIKRLKRARAALFIGACITHSYPWARIIFRLFGAIGSFEDFYDLLKSKNFNEPKNQKTIDAFKERLKSFSEISPLIKLAVIGLAAIYWSFPINMISQYFVGNMNSNKYYRGEVGYIWISMIAKSFLTWTIFSGALREDNRRDLGNCNNECK